VGVAKTVTPTPNPRLNLTLHPKGFEMSSRKVLIERILQEKQGEKLANSNFFRTFAVAF